VGALAPEIAVVRSEGVRELLRDENAGLNNVFQI
jgi:hypothetical protein